MSHSEQSDKHRRAPSPTAPQPSHPFSLTRDQWKAALRPILRFAGLFVLIMGLLAIPWPGVQEMYSSALRKTGAWTMGSLGPKAVVLFYEIPIQRSSSVDISMNVGDRTMVRKNGTLPTVNQTFSSRYIAYLPTAFLMALILATPLPWRRRLWSFLIGFVLIHLFIAAEIFLMILYLFNHTEWLSLFKLGSFGVKILDALWNIFIYQIAARFFIPVMIWILVSFRAGDLNQMLGEAVKPSAGSRSDRDKSSHR